MSFQDAVVKGNFSSRNNTYPLGANFRRMSVGGTADFSHNTFHQVPDFTDSKIERPPDVSGMEVLALRKNGFGLGGRLIRTKVLNFVS